jgi:transposase
VAGDKVFVDYSGKTVPIVDRVTGEIRPAQLFVAVLGASNYTFAEVSWTQALPDWIGAHVHMFAFFQGNPGSWSPIISSRASTSRRSTTRRRTAPTRAWRRIYEIGMGGTAGAPPAAPPSSP